MKKKMVCSIMLFLLFGLSLIHSGIAMGEEKTLIKFSAHVPPNDDLHAWAGIKYFKNQVEKLSAGNIEVQVFPSNQLGSERESLESLKMGSHQMDYVSTGAIPSFFPEIQVLGVPYLFKSRVVAWSVLDGPFGQDLSQAMAEKSGLRCLAWGENGIRHFVAVKKDLKTPADLKGLKVRTMENPAHMALVRALGANPTPIPWGDLYTSLQQGVVDGYEMPISLIEFVKFYEVSKYIVLDGHLYDPAPLFINEKFYKSLSVSKQAIINQAAKEMVVVVRGMISYLDEVKSLEALKKNGMTIYVPSEAEMAMFKKASVDPVTKVIEEKVGKALLDKLMSAVKDAEVKSGK